MAYIPLQNLTDEVCKRNEYYCDSVAMAEERVTDFAFLPENNISEQNENRSKDNYIIDSWFLYFSALTGISSDFK